MTGPGAGDQGALAALHGRSLKHTLFLQGLQMIADGGGRAQADSLSNFPNGGGIAVFGHKRVDKRHDFFGLVAGSGHRRTSIL